MKDIIVIKRDNTDEPFSINKIRRTFEWASQGTGINSLELEQHLTGILPGKIPSKKILENLITAVLKMLTDKVIAKDDDFVDYLPLTKVAGRLALMNLYKEAMINRKGEPFGYSQDFYSYLKETIDKSIYDRLVLDCYNKQEVRGLYLYINQKADMEYSYSSLNALTKRYLTKDGARAWELPQERFLLLAMLFKRKAHNRKKEVLNLYSLLSDRVVSPASPTLSNLGKPGGSATSCFIQEIPDNIEGIYHGYKQSALIAKNGGGIGKLYSRVRAKGSWVKGRPGVSKGVIGWIRQDNDLCLAVDQLGVRNAAMTIGLNDWHLDLLDFLELQTESGEVRDKANDIFPQVIYSDLFFDKAEKDEDWYRFDPYEVKQKLGVDLVDLNKQEFEKVYERLVSMINLDGSLKPKDYLIEDKETIYLWSKTKARHIVERVVENWIETGLPYSTFKDTINKFNPNKHIGNINLVNLCVESFSVTKPSTNYTKESSKDGRAYVEWDMGLTHSCNLSSLNLARIPDDKTLKRACYAALDMLNELFDISVSPIPEAQRHNDLLSVVGVGTLGLADWLAIRKIPYLKSKEVVKELYEKIYYYLVKRSIEWAREHGPYKLYKGSDWDKGVILGRPKSWYINKENTKMDWKPIFDDLAKYGIFNSQLTAIAPNSSTSIIQDTSASVLPIYKKVFFEENGLGSVLVYPPYLKEAWWYYTELSHTHPLEVIEIVAGIQEWVDSGISLEIKFDMNNIEAKDLINTLIFAHKRGLKALYYVRVTQAEYKDAKNSATDCISCKN